ncbi:MAG: YaaA family protein [Eubacteriales bacterium]|nr:YaaA family protein [Eubacteriales bacterium]
MKVFLSPAKNMRSVPAAVPQMTKPRFLAQTERLAACLRGKAPFELESVLAASASIALRAAGLFQDWSPEGGAPAVLAFDGLAYKYLEADSFSPDDFAFAQQHLRLFSAFYGPLRPLDAIRPYRLELAHKLDGESLYAFWGRAFYEDLFAGDDTAVNLASNEYSKAVRRYLTPADRLVTCEFLTYRKGKLRCLPAVAKMARGRMARYIVQNKITSPEQLPFFDWNGFAYEQSLSDNHTLTFISRD